MRHLLPKDFSDLAFGCFMLFMSVTGFALLLLLIGLVFVIAERLP